MSTANGVLPLGSWGVTRSAYGTYRWSCIQPACIYMSSSVTGFVPWPASHSYLINSITFISLVLQTTTSSHSSHYMVLRPCDLSLSPTPTWITQTWKTHFTTNSLLVLGSKWLLLPLFMSLSPLGTSCNMLPATTCAEDKPEVQREELGTELGIWLCIWDFANVEGLGRHTSVGCGWLWLIQLWRSCAPFVVGVLTVPGKTSLKVHPFSAFKLLSSIWL